MKWFERSIWVLVVITAVVYFYRIGNIDGARQTIGLIKDMQIHHTDHGQFGCEPEVVTGGDNSPVITGNHGSITITK